MFLRENLNRTNWITFQHKSLSKPSIFCRNVFYLKVFCLPVFCLPVFNLQRQQLSKSNRLTSGNIYDFFLPIDFVLQFDA